MSTQKLGAIVCEHIVAQKSRIGRAVRTNPVVEEDSGWQFLCGTASEENSAKVQLWTVSEALDLEPTLSAIIDTEPPVAFVRRGNQWIKEE
jgi:hypothetical protein